MNKPIIIVGGGLAGLTLGIGLRRHDVPVTIWEAGSYPRHRVCGEFINGRGLATLEDLGLREKLLAAGACWARSAAVFMSNVVPAEFTLPQSALCLSRYVLDELLAREFQREGGHLCEHQRWNKAVLTEGVVRASGHRVAGMAKGWRWLGLKVHARDVVLAADLELHLVANGYVGLCRLANEVNVCGLFRTREALPDLRQRWREWLRGQPGSMLEQRFATAKLDEGSFSAVAGLSLQPRGMDTTGECVLGDALTMIPPATGNGMSMAFESAELATEPLLRYARGTLDWNRTSRLIAEACHRRFAARLRTAALLHRAVFLPMGRRLALNGLARFPKLWPMLFRWTR